MRPSECCSNLSGEPRGEGTGQPLGCLSVDSDMGVSMHNLVPVSDYLGWYDHSYTAVEITADNTAIRIAREDRDRVFLGLYHNVSTNVIGVSADIAGIEAGATVDTARFIRLGQDHPGIELYTERHGPLVTRGWFAAVPPPVPVPSVFVIVLEIFLRRYRRRRTPAYEHLTEALIHGTETP